MDVHMVGGWQLKCGFQKLNCMWEAKSGGAFVYASAYMHGLCFLFF